MKNLHEYLKRLSMPKFITVAIIPQLILYFIIYYIIDGCIRNAPFEVTYMNNFMIGSLYGLYACVIEAPFRETLIFQVFIVQIILLYSDSKKSQITAAIFSSIIFGFAHFSQTQDLLWACFWGARTVVFGMILCYSYLIYRYKYENKLKGIAMGALVVFLIHSGNNLLSAAFLKFLSVLNF